MVSPIIAQSLSGIPSLRPHANKPWVLATPIKSFAAGGRSVLVSGSMRFWPIVTAPVTRQLSAIEHLIESVFALPNIIIHEKMMVEAEAARAYREDPIRRHREQKDVVFLDPKIYADFKTQTLAANRNNEAAKLAFLAIDNLAIKGMERRTLTTDYIGGLPPASRHDCDLSKLRDIARTNLSPLLIDFLDSKLPPNTQKFMMLAERPPYLY